MCSQRIAVVGATGNIGTSLVQALSEDDRVSSILGIARRIPEWEVPKLEMATADQGQDDLTELFSGCDAVVHLGWLFQPTHDPSVTWQTNVLGSRLPWTSLLAKRRTPFPLQRYFGQAHPVRAKLQKEERCTHALV